MYRTQIMIRLLNGPTLKAKEIAIHQAEFNLLELDGLVHRSPVPEEVPGRERVHSSHYELTDLGREWCERRLRELGRQPK